MFTKRKVDQTNRPTITINSILLMRMSPPHQSQSEFTTINSTPNKQIKSDIDSVIPSPYRRLHTDLENLLVHEDNFDNHSSSLSLSSLSSSYSSSTNLISNITLNSSSSSSLSKMENLFQKDGENNINILTKNNKPVLSENSKEYPKSPTKTLWVGNLEGGVDKTLIYKIFGKFGTINSIRLVLNKKCAFINYEKVEHATSAKNALNGDDIGGNIVKIKYSSPITSDSCPSTNFSSSLDIANAPQQQNSVWIGQLGEEVTAQMLRESFSPFGNIESIKLLEGKGCAFINFSSLDDANRARQDMMGRVVGSSVLRTGYCKNPTLFPSGSSMSSLNGSSDGCFNSTLYTKVIPSTKDLFRENGDHMPPSLISEMREWKRILKHFDGACGDVGDQEQQQFRHWISEKLISLISLASIDPIGNVIVQKAVEIVDIQCLREIIYSIQKWIPTIGVHKNGTWAMQKILKVISKQNGPEGFSLQTQVAEAIKPYVVALMHDQFGNYVIQGCLPFKDNQFIFDAFYNESYLISSNRFGSRSMKSCLEHSNVTSSQRKYVAMALLNYSGILVNDYNSCIVLNWMLDSVEDLPSCAEYLTTILKDEFMNMAIGSKPKSALLMKIVKSSESNSLIKGVVIDKLFPISSVSFEEEYRTILKDETSAEIIKLLLLNGDLGDRIRISNKIFPIIKEINRLPHLVELEGILESIKDQIDNVDSLSEFNLPSKGSSNAVGGPCNTDINFASIKKNNFPEMSPAIKARIDLKDDINSASSSSLIIDLSQKDSFGPGLLNKEQQEP